MPRRHIVSPDATTEYGQRLVLFEKGTVSDSGERRVANVNAKLVTVDRNGSNRTLPNQDHSLFTALPSH